MRPHKMEENFEEERKKKNIKRKKKKQVATKWVSCQLSSHIIRAGFQEDSSRCRREELVGNENHIDCR